MLSLDMMQTLALAGVMLFVGYGICRLVPPLAKYNIPAPVVGGLLVSVATLVAHLNDQELAQFNTALQNPLMIAFFTTIGFGASLSLLRIGGRQVLIFLLFATVLCAGQNLVGAVIAQAYDMSPLFGILCGSVTLTGGPGTGLAFADAFEKAGVPSAGVIAIAAAMVGIVCGGLIGGPIGTFLVERYKLEASGAPVIVPLEAATRPVEELVAEPPSGAPPGEDVESFVLLKTIVIILVAMWVGSELGAWITAGLKTYNDKFTLPPYIGAMIVAAVIRNLDDFTGWIGFSQRTMDDLGNVSLSLFIVLALMTLKLWELGRLAQPLLVILAAQILLIAVVCIWPLFPMMGRDRDAAVMAGGFCGFMLGTTANAMAIMKVLVDRYGPAPRAFLVVPIVGAFFIDFVNAIMITGLLNWLQ